MGATEIMDVENAIREYLPTVLHMSLATSAGGRPWVCEVHFVYDNELNIYWRSKAVRRHSQEIANNPHVAGNIVQQHALDDKPRGLYFEGTAEILEGLKDDDPVFELFHQRLGTGPEIVADAQDGEGHRVYKVTVSDWYLFDSRESNPSQKYRLEK